MRHQIARFSIGAMLVSGLVLSACGSSTDGGGTPASPSEQQTASGQASAASNPIAPTASIGVQGAVSGLSGTCPAVSFGVASDRVRGSANTQFRRIDCGELRNGTFVAVDGLRQADGSILAREIELEDEPPVPVPPPVNAPQEQEIEGLVQGLAGACPSLTLTVGGDRVRTTSATEFNRISCAQLQNGMRVEVEGTRDASGVLVARELESDQAEDDDNRGPGGREQRVEGALANLGDACPARSFSVSGRLVSTSASTRFDDTSCARLLAGMHVEVRGVTSAGGTIEATRVSRED